MGYRLNRYVCVRKDVFLALVMLLVTLIVSLVFLLKSDGISFFSDQYYRSQLTAKEAKNVINKNYNWTNVK